MSAVEVKQVPVPCLRLGEGPHWLQDQKALLYVDILNKTVWRYFVDTGSHETLKIDDGGREWGVNFVVPVEGDPDLLVVGLGKTLSLVRWPLDHRHSQTLTVTPTTLYTADRRFNDAKCDFQGRLWAGTLAPMAGDSWEILEYNTSPILSFDHHLNPTTWIKTMTLSNGLAWSPDKKSFYFIDTSAKDIYHFDYDDTAGAISNQRVLLNYEAAGLTDQMPDGMTIDLDGNLWVACVGSGQVICVDPQAGRVIRKVAVPSPNVTSVCWGGADYATLYVTSGTVRLSAEQMAAWPSAGGTFAITGLGTRGLPPYNYKVDLNKLKDKMKK